MIFYQYLLQAGSPYIILVKQEYFCLQGKDYNKGEKDKYIEKKTLL